MSSTEVAKGFKKTNPGNIDEWRGPYTSIADANDKVPNTIINVDGVPTSFRKGKFVEIGTGGLYVTYWWSGSDYADDKLVPYINVNLSAYLKDAIILPQKNLFDLTSLVNGPLNASGIISGDGTDPANKTTGFIPVTPSTSYTISGFLTTGTMSGTHRYAWYTSAGVFLASASLSISGARETTMMSPANAYLLRVTVKTVDDTAGLYNLVQIEKGSKTTYEPYTLSIVGASGKNIKNANLDLYDKGQINSMFDAVPTSSTTAVFLSKNMANPASFVPDQYFNKGDGYTVVTDARYWTSGFIPVTEGLQYSGTNMRFVYYYRSDGTVVLPSIDGATTTFTVPTGQNITQIRFTGYTANFAAFQFEQSGAPTSYVAYAGFKTYTDKLGGKEVQSSSVKEGTKMGNSVLATMSDLAGFSGGPVTYGSSVVVLKDANFYYIRTYFNETYDLVQKVTFETINNKSFDFQNTNLILKTAANTIAGYSGILVHSNGDDTAPIRTANEGHIGEGHGFQQPRVTMTAHGKTASDLLSKWTDGLHNFYLVQIVDANNLMFYCERYLSAGHWVTEKTFNSTTLTHVSGAVNTANINATTTTIDQKYPVTQNNNNRVYLDGKEITSDGIYTGKEVKFLSEYDIVDAAYLTIQNPFVWNAGPSAMRISIAFIYQTNGACVTHHEINFKRDKPIEYWYVNQATPIGTLAAPYTRRFGYLPKTLPVAGVDYNAVVETTTDLPSAFFTPATFIDPNLPPDRHIQFLANSAGVKQLGFAMGFNTEYGVAKNSLRKLLTNSWNLAPKSYPRVIYSYPGLDQVIHVIGYRVWFDATVGAATCVYSYKLGNVDYLFIDYKTAIVKEVIPVNPLFTNRTIEIVEQYGNLTLLSTEKVPANGLIVSATSGGSLLLKLI